MSRFPSDHVYYLPTSPVCIRGLSSRHSIEPPPADPDEISSLWKAVRNMPSSGSTAPSRKSKAKSKAAESGSSLPIRQSQRVAESSARGNAALITPARGPMTPSATSVVSGETMSESGKSVATRISPRSSTFNEQVLAPRGIIIARLRRHATFNPCAHFGTTQLQLYGTELGYEDVPIWLDFTADDLKQMRDQYRDMAQEDLCEEEFAWYALSTSLRSTLIASNAPSDSRMRVRRMLQLTTTVGDDLWQCPPIVREDMLAADRYSWDLRPDCAYWLSVKGFNDDYSNYVKAHTYQPNKKKIICPYLTVEFKRQGEADTVAISQIAASGAVALYNRWLLHVDIQELGANQGVAPLEAVRHYALTMVGYIFHVWVLTPMLDAAGNWAGCTVQELAKDDCCTDNGLRCLALWINEIHRWGLKVHAPACKAAIKVFIKHTQSARVSDIGSFGGSSD